MKTIFSILIISLVIIYLSFCLVVQIISFEIPMIYKSCKVEVNQLSDRNIILRLDDIQSHYLQDLQIKMMNDALDRNLTLSLGVIPFNLLKDNKLSKYLNKNKCKLEICLHGFDNVDYEFSNLSYDEADRKIKKGLKILNKIEKNIVTFIPPNNAFSNESEQAIYDNEMLISAGFWNSKYGFSQSAYDWEKYELIDYKKVLEECNKDLDNNETCIIMLHPQDYINNYSEYTNLLDGLNKLNATIVNFRDFNFR